MFDTPFMVFNITKYCLELREAITSHYRFHLLIAKTKRVVWTLYNMIDFTWFKNTLFQQKKYHTCCALFMVFSVRYTICEEPKLDA